MVDRFTQMRARFLGGEVKMGRRAALLQRLAEFEAQDIASIPISTDGKFRVHKCDIVGEKDTKEIGLEE